MLEATQLFQILLKNK